MSIKNTYELEKDTPPASPWEDYAQEVYERWNKLLASSESDEERKLQIFLEQNPCLIPGIANTVFDDLGAHGPMLNAVITQPPLHGLGSYIPDFMWINRNSSVVSPVLVEIETPNKRWFRKDGVPTSDYSQALNQISEWKSWFNNSANIEVFRQFYGISDRTLDRCAFKPQYILVYGSRRELEEKSLFNKKRAEQQRSDECHMTFDRLRPNPLASESLCVSIFRPRQFVAVSWPPTLHLSPLFAEERSHIEEKEQAVALNGSISIKRKEFLLRRMAYWDNWASSSKGLKMLNTGDRE